MSEFQDIPTDNHDAIQFNDIVFCIEMECRPCCVERNRARSVLHQSSVISIFYIFFRMSNLMQHRFIYTRLIYLSKVLH